MTRAIVEFAPLDAEHCSEERRCRYLRGHRPVLPVVGSWHCELHGQQLNRHQDAPLRCDACKAAELPDGTVIRRPGDIRWKQDPILGDMWTATVPGKKVGEVTYGYGKFFARTSDGTFLLTERKGREFPSLKAAKAAVEAALKVQL